MHIIKRDGRKQNVSFDKITARVNQLTYGLNMDFVEPISIAQKVCGRIQATEPCNNTQPCCNNEWVS